MRKTALLLLILFMLVAAPLHAQLVINEFMADNDNIITDNAGDYDDWIELYNDYDYAINLSGYYMTDDLGDPTQWACPDVSIPAKGYLIIWADDDGDQGELHANFKLGKDGEEIGLYDGTDFVDSLTFGEQTTDISFGRYPDGEDSWYFMEESSPGDANVHSGSLTTEPPVFSPSAGFYSGSVTVELSAPQENTTIRYTLDGADPTEGSAVYTSPILLTETTVVRAKSYRSGYDPSEITTSSYIINENFDIATLSVVTDPDNLWDDEIGIYTNWSEKGDDWERPASVEFFKGDDQLGFSENIGLRIHGDTSREYDKKPFRLYFRSEYGQSWLNYAVFEAKSNMDEYKRLIVHSAGTDQPANPYGHGWTLLRDPLMHDFGRKIDIIYAANHPVALFLNGDQWGVYNMIERIDKYYIETNFGESDADLIENGRYAKEGDMVEWNEMISFFESHDLSINSNFETAQTLMDVDNFTDYNIVEIFGGNEDWPHHNLYAFRPNKEDAVWRWILWDMDGCFGPYGVNSNTLEWATRDDESTLILRKLLENQDYEYHFINRYADLLNTIFLSSNVNHLIDSLEAYYREDISFETDKWGSSPEQWEEDGIDDELRDFANRRPGYCRRHIREEFGISENHDLTINTPQGGEGRVRVNTIYVQSFPWTGVYFDAIPIELEAIPDAGYQFVRWSDPSLPETPLVTVTLHDDDSVHPIFEGSAQEYVVVINEINYNSASEFDPEDWVELYNNSDNSINVSNWHFRDDDDEHDFIFPDGTTIPAHGYLILSMDQSAFGSLFPEVTNVIGDVDFGLGGGGDDVRIYNAEMNLVDSVSYDDDDPWPTAPDGNGPTLELIDPELDNTLGQNWQASENHGTPGEENSNQSQPDITDLRASVVGENILLEWSQVDGISAYNVYRDTHYDFVPDGAGDSNRIATAISDEDAGTEGVQWTDTGNGADIVGDVATNYFYKVTAVSEEESQPSNVAGEFDYELITTEGTDINRIVVLMNTADTRSPICTAEDLAQAIPYCTDVYWWDANGQGSVGHVKGQPFNDFDVFPGQPYTVNVSKDTIWTVAGSYADVSFDLVTTEGTDINRIGVPLAKSGLTDAEQLGSDIPNCTDVYVWDAEGQGTMGHVVGVPFNNFAVRAGYPYSVSISSPTVWPEYHEGVACKASYPKLDDIQKNEADVFIGNNVPHTVYGELQGTTDFASDDENLTLKAWITSRPNEVLRSENSGIGLENNYWWIGVSRFSTQWRVGDSLVVQFTNEENGLNGSVLVVLSDAGSDYAGQIQLTNAMENPSGDSNQLPKEFALMQNYPNPFNPTTTISFELPKNSKVQLTIYNAMGQRVKNLAEGNFPAGHHAILWDATDDLNRPVQNGIYFGKFIADEFQYTIKMMLVK